MTLPQHKIVKKKFFLFYCRIAMTFPAHVFQILQIVVILVRHQEEVLLKIQGQIMNLNLNVHDYEIQFYHYWYLL